MKKIHAVCALILASLSAGPAAALAGTPNVHSQPLQLAAKPSPPAETPESAPYAGWNGNVPESPVAIKTVDIIVDQLQVEIGEVIPTATFENLGADSLDMVQLVLAVEAAFDIEISGEPANGLKMVGDLTNLVAQLVGGPGKP